MRVEVVSQSDSEAGGYKEVVLAVKGGEPYRQFKYESGVHRVQRVPATEAQGRVHTSTATVAVLPEAEEVDVQIDPKDLDIDTFKASGAGGQHVNKTETRSASPTGRAASWFRAARNVRRLQNRERAMQMLRSVLLDRKRREADAAVGSLRRSQVGTGDRSEKIRTYNFPQDRITDHRLNESFRNIRGVLDGDLDPLVDPLQTRREGAAARRRTRRRVRSRTGQSRSSRASRRTRPRARCAAACSSTRPGTRSAWLVAHAGDAEIDGWARERFARSSRRRAERWTGGVRHR